MTTGLSMLAGKLDHHLLETEVEEYVYSKEIGRSFPGFQMNETHQTGSWMAEKKVSKCFIFTVASLCMSKDLRFD